MPKINRTLMLKSVEIIVPDNRTFAAQPIDEMIKQIAKKAKTARERHVPDLDTVENGTRCFFIDNIEKAPGFVKGTLFRFCSYLKGHLPMGLTPDFSHGSVDVAAGKLVDTETSARREPVTVLWCIAFGHVIAMESVKGAGGVGALEHCLWGLVRQFVDSRYPRLHLYDVESRQFKAAIQRAGGISEAIMDVVSSHEKPQHEFGELLNSARSKVSGTDLVRLHYKAGADSKLKREDVMRAYQDLEAEELDRLTLVLKDGSKLVGTDQCRVRKIVKLTTDTVGRINEGELAVEMSQFLIDLQKQHDGVSVITADGTIA